VGAPRKYDDSCRQAINRLVNLEGKRAPEAARIIESGLAGIPAQTIPESTVKLIANQERGDITDRPKAQQLRELTGLAVRVIHDGFSRQQAKSNEADPDDTLKLVRSLRELEPLLTDKPAEKDREAPKGTLGGLSSVPNTEPEPTHPKSAAVRSLRT
jgi:hypothetical protein